MLSEKVKWIYPVLLSPMRPLIVIECPSKKYHLDKETPSIHKTLKVFPVHDQAGQLLSCHCSSEWKRR